jgi:DNA-directed RNA polymerase subunit omega
MRNDRSLNLHARSETARDGVACDAISVFASGDSGPGDEHTSKLAGLGAGARREFALDVARTARCFHRFYQATSPTMRDDYIKEALKAINDPNILINVVSRRVKQLKRGNRPLVESLEKLSPEDTALREIIEGKISHELANS